MSSSPKVERPHIERPLSPHLQIYRPQITSVLSITHRATGVFMSLGSLVLVYWLWAAAYSPAAYACLENCGKGIFLKVVFAGWVFAFYYHLANGIRHLFWDAGKGYSIPAATRSGLAVVAFAFIMTALTWGCILTRSHASETPIASTESVTITTDETTPQESK